MMPSVCVQNFCKTMANDTTDMSLERGWRVRHIGVKKWGAHGDGGRGNEGRVPQPHPIHGDSLETKNEVVPLSYEKKPRYENVKSFKIFSYFFLLDL